MPKNKQIIDVEKIDLIDVQHFWLMLHEMVGMTINDRPRDDDATYMWVTFNSCVKATSMLGLIDGAMLKLILQIKRPSNNDNYERLDKYEQKMFDVCEKILDKIGWPKDIEEYNGT